jgi:tetratricopeptide (TPR) repeat protein
VHRIAILIALCGVARADWEVKRSPFDPQLVARYKKALEKNPEDATALHKLTELYKKYKSVDELARELESNPAALGELERERGRHDAALAAFKKALARTPDDERAEIALADELLWQKQPAEARKHLERVLPRVADDKRRRHVIEQLINSVFAPEMGLSRQEARKTARGWYDELLKAHPADDDLRRELAEMLASHDAPADAAAEWNSLAKHQTKDPAQRAQSYRRVGELYEQAGDDAAALAAYEQVFAAVPRGHYLRREAAEKIVGVSRHRDALRPLAARWEKEWPVGSRDFAEWDVLARLYDELGDLAHAEEAWKRALALDPHAIESRRRLIALYERAGRDGEVVAEYRRLIQAAPGEPRFRLELAERLWKQPGGDKEALEICAHLGKETRDPSLHTTLAELYERWGKQPEALAERERLVQLEPNEESHLINLGELWFQRGKRDKALEIWRKLPSLSGKKEKLWATLGEVYLEHDLAPEAVDAYQRAIKLQPDDPSVKKGLAGALERMHRDPEAVAIWIDLFDGAAKAGKRGEIVEIKQRLLGLLLRLGQLPARTEQWRHRFYQGSDVPSVRAAYGLLAADALVKLGRIGDAQQLLADLSAKATDPELQADGLVSQAALLRAQHRWKEAIAALRSAAEKSPSRAREIYAQIAELSLVLYRDADALEYAKKAVELGRTDARAQLRLAEVLEKRDQIDEAATAYQRALELNDRDWKTWFVLARLELRRGRHAEAAKAYRTVIRRCPDEELVVRAAHVALDLDEFLGSLGELERDLAPLYFAQPDKRVYRNLLVELAERYAEPLVARAHRGDTAARAELARLGEHAMRPLLDVLVDSRDGGDPQQQRAAIELLGELGNPSAAEPLFKLAQARPVAKGKPGPGVELRVEAAIAAARVAGPHDLAALAKLADDPEKHVRIAALFGLGRLRSNDAVIVRALGDANGEVEAAACLAVSAPARIGDLLKVLRDPARTEIARAACAYTAGQLANDAATRDALALALVDGGDTLARVAAWSLARVGGAKRALVGAAFLRRDEVRRAALAALAGAQATIGEPERGADGLDVRGWIASIGPSTATGVAPANWRELAGDAAQALADALGRHRDLQLRALADLDARSDGPAFGPLTTGALSPADRATLAEAAARIQPSLEKLALKADPPLRARAVRVLAKLKGGAPTAIAALADSDASVRIAALAGLAASADGDERIASALERALKAPDWRERCAAAQALSSGRAVAAVSALGGALDDASGFVREAAARALGPAGAPAVAPLERHAADEADEVRAAVAAALGETRAPAARAPLRRLAKDDSPKVRAAAEAALSSLGN